MLYKYTCVGVAAYRYTTTQCVHCSLYILHRCVTVMENRSSRDNRNDTEDSEHNKKNLAVEEDHKISISQTEQNEVTYNVLLRRTVHNNTVESTHTLTVKKFPESVANLKNAIQHELHIPIYDQKVSFGFCVMDDSNASLDSYRLKDGDQLTVEYSATAEVESVFLLIAAFRDALEFLKNVQTQLASKEISIEFSTQISDKLHVRDIGRYVQQLTTGDDKTNAKFFLQNGGLHVIKELHSLLLKQPWDKICHIDLQYLEKALLCLLLTVCARIPPQQTNDAVNNLSNIVGSFLRVPISSRPITSPENTKLSGTSSPEQLQVLIDVMVTALGCLCK